MAPGVTHKSVGDDIGEEEEGEDEGMEGTGEGDNGWSEEEEGEKGMDTSGRYYGQGGEARIAEMDEEEMETGGGHNGYGVEGRKRIPVEDSTESCISHRLEFKLCMAMCPWRAKCTAGRQQNMVRGSMPDAHGLRIKAAVALAQTRNTSVFNNLFRWIGKRWGHGAHQSNRRPMQGQASKCCQAYPMQHHGSVENQYVHRLILFTQICFTLHAPDSKSDSQCLGEARVSTLRFKEGCRT